jgi:hypothetical protein
MLAALRHRLLDRSSAAAVLVAAKREHFSARHWKPLLAAAGVCTRPDLLRLCVATDVKRRDAELAVVRVAARASAAPRSPRAAPPVAPRYPGHDPLLGMTEAEARRGLARWLTDTGRYRRFTAEPPVAPAAVAQLWSELQDRHELHTELLHWHAVRVFEADGRP